ncbi:MAG: relaxase/mobilization nuclease domain-containing protein [Bacteroidales bacterium]|nr:relaxase/mobilization nuclease domain-containing protein [Bacteroidales bacterium]
MAVTKTHPIKSTLKAAIDYILNPEKTDGKLLASSFGCGLETADIEFAWTRDAAGDRGTHLARHLIQSFAVGETTPEEAHKIGMELAQAVLGGKYEFVLTTHVDKDHLHNHLIFNAVSFVDYKKYHSNRQTYHFIRRTSDRICKEHGLSVITPGQDRGKSYAEYHAEKQGKSYKAKLKTAIDTLIPQVKDFDELLRRLQEMGYEIKRGKYVSCRAAGQEYFTRLKEKTLGAAYTEEAIKERIKGVYIAKSKPLREDKKIRLVVDIENSIKAQQSAGYERWAKIHNLKQAAKSMNFLTENKIEYYSDLETKIADIMTTHDAAARAVKEVETRMSDLSLLIKHTNTYRQLKPIYDAYRKSPDKEKYLRGHESEIILFEAAAKALKEMQIKKLPDLAALRKEYDGLRDRKSKLYEDYRQAKKQMQEYAIIKKNVDSILYPSQSRAREQER